MEGYGRWVALILFVSLIIFSIIEDFKKDKKGFWRKCLLFALVLLLALIIFSLSYFIWNYW
jgi:putative effector of murein hydrolase